MLKRIVDQSASKRVVYPLGYHQAFLILVQKAVQTAAIKQNISLERYLQGIYYSDTSLSLFTDSRSLLELYEQYHDLIDPAVKSLNRNGKMSPLCKAFLCYRIYLHGMLVNYQVLSHEVGLKHMIFCVREFFYARERIFTNKDANKLADLISRMAR